MSTLFRRTLTTLTDTAPSSSRSLLESSKTSTLPLALRKRRADLPTSPAIHRPLTPAREARFQEQLKGKAFPAEYSEEKAREVFMAEHDAWRSRIRGHTQTLTKPPKSSGAGEKGSLLSSKTPGSLFTSPFATPAPETLAAERTYLPNVQIRLMRNSTPPNQPYDPYLATFRIPPSMTKPDLRSYLSAVYGLNVTFIRTDNYIAPTARIGTAGEIRRKAGSVKTYKRAVVGLHEPFHYPDDIAELDAVIAAASPSVLASSSATEEEKAEIERLADRAKAGKGKREEWLNVNFMVGMQDSGRKRSLMKMAKGWRWRSKTHDNKGNIVREIMQRRRDRENAVKDAVTQLRAGSSSVVPSV